MNSTLFLDTFPITQSDRHFVENMIRQSGCTESKRETIRKKLLAIRVVERWLTLLEIPTDFQQSYSSNPTLNAGDDVADLWLPNVGRLECCAVLPGAVAMRTPPESWTDRIGYIAVEISEDNKQGQLLGFLESTTTEIVALDELESADALLMAIATLKVETSLWERLQSWGEQLVQQGWERLQEEIRDVKIQPAYGTQTVAGICEIIQTTPSLSARLSAIQLLKAIGEGTKQEIELLTEIIRTTDDNGIRWEAVATLAKFHPNHPQAGIFRNKKIRLNLHLQESPLVLSIALRTTENKRIQVKIEVKSDQPSHNLPAGLKLAILDENNKVLSETESCKIDEVREQSLGQSLLQSFHLDAGMNFRIRLGVNQCFVIEDISI